MPKCLAFPIAFLLFAGLSNAHAAIDDPSWSQQLQKWRADHAAELSAPEGWLSLVGLEWLKPGDNTFGTSADSQVRFHAPGNRQFGIIDNEQSGLRLKAPKSGFPGDLSVDGHPATEQAIVVDGPEPTKFADGTLTFFVIRRGDRLGLRIKDSQAPTRIDFHGLHWFEPNPRYRIEAQWVPFLEPKHVLVESVIGTRIPGIVLGTANFTMDGQALHLEAVVQDENPRSLLFVIRDATSGKTTYAASRFLHTGLPDHGLREPGKILLDFNRLENPPCAYTPFATCPLPPESNRLKIALAAGELKHSH
jgi:uncharacterized protein (DUF1684 family)